VGFGVVAIGFGVGDEVVCGVMLDELSLLILVMFVLSGFCWVVPLVRFGGVRRVLLFVEKVMIPALMIATATIIATSFHLYV
jgi:hypothetical protein